MAYRLKSRRSTLRPTFAGGAAYRLVAGAMAALSAAPLVFGMGIGAASAQDAQFPFGAELTLDANPMRGSKKMPTLEIGAAGEAKVDLWCKRTQGQFSVAGDTVIFIPGPLQDNGCPADRAMADDALFGALSAATNWKRQGDVLVLTGATTLRFRLNTN